MSKYAEMDKMVHQENELVRFVNRNARSVYHFKVLGLSNTFHLLFYVLVNNYGHAGTLPLHYYAMAPKSYNVQPPK